MLHPPRLFGCFAWVLLRPAGMGRPFVLALLCVVLLSTSRPAHAQSGDVAVRTAGETTNLFARVDLDREAAGFDVTLPPTWDLLGVSVLHYGSETVPAVLQPRTRTTSRIVPDRSIQGPHVLVLRVRPSKRLGSASWTLTPLRRAGDGQLQMDRAAALRQRVTLQEAPEASDDNRVLQLRPTDAPLYVRPRALPPMAGRSPLTVEFWIATTETDQILVSTWTGNEQEPYPLEMVVDPSGYVRGYTGRPGRHEAVVSETPLADGRWHHVAVAYDPNRERLRLYTNGVAVDSLRLASLPAPLGPVSMAVGGRLPERASAPDSARYTGRLDELRVWSVVRTAADLQQTMRRPLTAAPEDAPSLASDAPEASPALVLGFSGTDADLESPDVFRAAPSPDVLRPSTLRLQGSMLQDLRAQSDGDAVRIQWSAPPASVNAFIVERSVDGQRFVEVARVMPEAERAAGAEDAPAYSVRDDGVTAQVVYYRVVQEFANGTVRRSATLKVGLGTSSDPDDPVRLIGNFPNPFPDATTVAYELDVPTEVDLSVWDLRGQKVTQITEGVQQAGYHEEPFDASALPSGTYFLRLRTASTTQSHRMVVLR